MGYFEAKARIDWVAAAPLLLLFAAACAPLISFPDRPYAGTRYFGIPIAGFSLGASLFLVFSRGRVRGLRSALDSVGERDAFKWAVRVIAAYAAFFIAFMYLRWNSLGYGFYDLGIYDQKLWLISEADWGRKLYLSVEEHASPVLIAYSLLHKLGISPFALQALQAGVTATSAIPAYLLAKRFIKSPAFVLFAVIVFLALPATQFNASGDFHPDHLYIPVILWALYFIESGRVLCAFPFIALSLAIKEPLIAGTALLGVYMAWAKRRCLAGACVFFISAAFLIFIADPAGFTGASGSAVLSDPSYGHLATGGLYDALAQALEPGKLRFPYFLLMPLLCIPLLSYKELMPAMAPIGIALLSSSANHHGVGSHYTAGALPFVFLAFVNAAGRLEKRFPGAVLTGLFAWVMTITLSFSVAHSPSPLSIGFWERSWSHGDWHISNYRNGARSASLGKALALIPRDPSAKVVAHSKVYSRVLSHRGFYRAFPDGWREADFIVLDMTREGYVYDRHDEDGFNAALRQVLLSGLFTEVYFSDGIKVFQRVDKTLRNQTPDFRS